MIPEPWPGAMAAASTGARNGKKRAQKVIDLRSQQRIGEASLQRNEREKRDKAIVASMVAKYDVDSSGSLGTEELAKMMREVAQSKDLDAPDTSEQDIACVHFFVNRSRQDPFVNSDELARSASFTSVAGNEIVAVCEIWCLYIDRLDTAREMLKMFDSNGSGKIEEEELKGMLQGLYGAGRGEVPDAVVSWIWERSNISGFGALNLFEVARALIAYNVWSGDDDGRGDPGRLRGFLNKDPTLPPPTPQSSACCIVQ